MSDISLPRFEVPDLTPEHLDSLWSRIAPDLAGAPTTTVSPAPADVASAATIAGSSSLELPTSGSTAPDSTVVHFPATPEPAAPARWRDRARSPRAWLSLAAGIAATAVVVVGGAAAWSALTKPSPPPTQDALVATLGDAMSATHAADSVHAVITASPDAASDGSSYCSQIDAALTWPTWTKQAVLTKGLAGFGCPAGATTTSSYAGTEVVRTVPGQDGHPGRTTSSQVDPGVSRAQLDADLYLDVLPQLIAERSGDIVRDGGVYLVPTEGATIDHCPLNITSDPAVPCSQQRAVDHLEIRLDDAGRLTEVRFEGQAESSAGIARRPDAGDLSYLAVDFGDYDATTPPPQPEAEPDTCTQIAVDTFDCGPEPEPTPTEKASIDDLDPLSRVRAAIDATLESAGFVAVNARLYYSATDSWTPNLSCVRFEVDRLDRIARSWYTTADDISEASLNCLDGYSWYDYGPETFYVYAKEGGNDPPPSAWGATPTALDTYLEAELGLVDLAHVLGFATPLGEVVGRPDGTSTMSFVLDPAAIRADQIERLEQYTPEEQDELGLGTFDAVSELQFPDRLTVVLDNFGRLVSTDTFFSDPRAAKAAQVAAAEDPTIPDPLTTTSLRFSAYDEPPRPSLPTDSTPSDRPYSDTFGDLCAVTWMYGPSACLFERDLD